LTDVARRLRFKASSAWRAWRTEPAPGPLAGKLELQDERLAAAHSEFRRQLQLTAEDLDTEARDDLLAKVQEDAEAQFEELNECMRGGNGNS